MKNGILDQVYAVAQSGIRGRQEIAKRTGLTHVQVANALKRLRASGRLEWPKGKHKASVWPVQGCLLSESWRTACNS